MTYAPHGALQQMLLGSNKLEQSCYNNRLQPAGMRLSGNASATTNCADSSDLLNLAFGYGASNTNNGNVMSQTMTMPKQAGGSMQLSQAYTYDGVNRIGTVGETVTAGGSGGGAWSFGYGYDRFGNMWVSGNTGLTLHVTTPTQQSQFNAATNRLTGTGVSYDAGGNLTAYPLLGTMTYDAENRQTQFTSGSTTVTYHYDGDGRRVKQVKGSETTVFVYDAFGNLAAEYTTASASGTAGRFYRTTDHLGSTRLVTNSTGAVVSRHDYTPFGEELQASSAAGQRNLVLGYGITSFRQKFTAKERDLESNLDYFLARYYASPMGRFFSVDPSRASADPKKPQSWNRYPYALNQPFVYVDPDGREPVTLTAIAVTTAVLGGGAAGATIGAVSEIARQKAAGAQNPEDFDRRKIVLAAVRGGAVGATGGLLVVTGQGVVAGSAALVTVGVTTGAAEAALDEDPSTDPLSASGVAKNAALSLTPTQVGSLAVGLAEAALTGVLSGGQSGRTTPPTKVAPDRFVGPPAPKDVPECPSGGDDCTIP